MGARTRSAVVFGGTGPVGSAVLRQLAQRGVPTVFSYTGPKAKAEALAAEYGHRSVQLDLRDPDNLHNFVRFLEREQILPNIVIYCATNSQNLEMEQITEDDWDSVNTVNGYSAFLACQLLGPRMDGGGDIVLVGALAHGQRTEAPVHFVASQGLLHGMTQSLGQALGPRGVRVNMVAAGPFAAESSRRDPEETQSFVDESGGALCRAGLPEEAARTIVWLALENAYFNGRVLPLNGGR